MKKNDSLILKLKKEIEVKEKLIESSIRFTPITNCSLTINGIKSNLHSMSSNGLLFALAYVNSLKQGLKEILPDETLIIDGYSSDDWILDIKTKFNVLNVSSEKERLKKLKEKLHNLLSTDTKVELEIENLKNQI
jgi:hypothetical protein